MSNVLLIGSTGLVGYDTYVKLYSRNSDYDYTLISRNVHPITKPLLSSSHKHYCCNASNVHILSNIIDICRPSIILLIANIRLLPSVLEACQFLNYLSLKPKIILVSTTGVFSPNPCYSNYYRFLEHTLLDSDFPHIILRPSLIYGHPEDQNISKSIRFISRYHFWPYFHGFRIGFFQPLYFEDLSVAICNSLYLKGNHAFNICGPECISYIDFFRLVINSSNYNVLCLDIPYFVDVIVRVLACFFPLTSRFEEKLSRLYEYKCFPIDSALAHSLYNPTPFRTGIKKLFLLMDNVK